MGVALGRVAVAKAFRYSFRSCFLLMPSLLECPVPDVAVNRTLVRLERDRDATERRPKPLDSEARAVCSPAVVVGAILFRILFVVFIVGVAAVGGDIVFIVVVVEAFVLVAFEIYELRFEFADGFFYSSRTKESKGFVVDEVDVLFFGHQVAELAHYGW